MGEISLKDLAQLIALLVSAGALVWAVWSFRTTARLNHYTEIDRQYAEIVKLRIAHTHLANPPLNPSRDAQKKSDKELQYEAYALLIWNFIETIHDRCKNDSRLLETWWPILKEEGKLHVKWLSLNEKKFKGRFIEWARENMDGDGKCADGLMGSIERLASGWRRPRVF
jgi:hypothetical protein